MVKSYTSALLGSRSTRPIDPQLLLKESEDISSLLSGLDESPLVTISDLKRKYAKACRLYYSLAAVSRRRVLDQSVRASIIKVLFVVRTSVERAILEDIEKIADQDAVMAVASSKSFFGYSAKQGVSIRFPLLSCVPTALCGGRCYAHDGRDREIHILFRASLNYHIAHQYEAGGSKTRREILQRLDRSINYGVDRALVDQKLAASMGFIRDPRIRFSHIGDMVATPEFATDLAKEIKRRNDTIQCVMYTRHPDAAKIDSGLFVINFSIDGESDPRIRFAPKRSRIVCSGWDGVTSDVADVTFLEHHVEKNSIPVGGGWACPITLINNPVHSCDQAECDHCFKRPMERNHIQPLESHRG